MGGGMARRLLSVGWPVHVHDKEAATQQVLQAAGAHGCDSPAAIAKAAESVIVCVIDAVQVQEVLDGPAGLLAHCEFVAVVIGCWWVLNEPTGEWDASVPLACAPWQFLLEPRG